MSAEGNQASADRAGHSYRLYPSHRTIKQDRVRTNRSFFRSLLDKKDGSAKTVNITDSTQIHRHGFLSQKKTNATALVPGLTITAKGIQNAEGQIDAKKVSFRPDAFAVTVAQEQDSSRPCSGYRRTRSG